MSAGARTFSFIFKRWVLYAGERRVFCEEYILGEWAPCFSVCRKSSKYYVAKTIFFFFLLLHNPCFLLATKLRCLFFYPRLKGKAIGLFSLTASNFFNFFFLWSKTSCFNLTLSQPFCEFRNAVTCFKVQNSLPFLHEVEVRRVVRSPNLAEKPRPEVFLLVLLFVNTCA